MESRFRIVIGMTLGAAIWAACANPPQPAADTTTGEEALVPTCTAPSPGPPDSLDPVADTAARRKVVAYAAQLPFEADSHPTGQSRQLTRRINDTLFALAPVAGIAPEKCAYRNTPTSLQRGRVIGRIVAAGAYDKLKLPAGSSYVWVDHYNAATDTARGVIIPVDPALPVHVLKVSVVRHPQYGRAFAEARWLFDPNDDQAWVSCVRYGCCYLEGGQPGGGAGLQGS